MREIIDSINEAEAKAAEIKAAALEKAAEIGRAAEERAYDIARLSEAGCKAYREKSIKAAEAEADRRYAEKITVKRAEASGFAAACLKNTDKAVNDIVRRITRGGC